MSRRRVLEWYKRFKDGREETADNELDKVLELVREDRRITVREVAEEAGISFGSTQSIMKDILGVRRLNTVLTKHGFTALIRKLPNRHRSGRFKNEPRPKKARKAPNKVKVMLTVFFDYQGIVHHEFQQQSSTITADSYLGVVRRFREAIRQKRPELWRSKSWILTTITRRRTQPSKSRNSCRTTQPLCSPNPPTVPNLAPSDFLLFGKLKKKLKGRKFQSIEEIKVESKKAMKAIPKTDYQRCFADWKKRSDCCLPPTPVYFLEDSRFYELLSPVLILLSLTVLQLCGNPNTHPLPRLPSTFHFGITTEPVKVDRVTEDNDMQRMTETEDEYFADALTNMQPHCDELVSRLTDAIRGLAMPRAEEALIPPFDGSYAANNFIQQLERTSEGPQDDATLQARLRTLLKGEPLSLYNELNLASLPYSQAKQTLIDLYPGKSEVTFTKFLTFKLNNQIQLGEYYRQKITMGLQLGLTNPIIVEALKEGLQANDQRLMRAIAPKTLTECTLHPVQYYSRALRPHEKNYTITELECLAVIDSVEKFRIYLAGVRSDCCLPPTPVYFLEDSRFYELLSPVLILLSLTVLQLVSL
ncbi:hypothetical protein LAZ67_12002060 [Cordylochernes scorpioides]|uniref:Reverse transcriptase RNase H-like domain-containing protein n=1 Tax=Cordylochernes scorpioides TaxID=51811 RepID=A0ABY6L6E2_9ARAC|nr:hypothetical protein LAZ67_12002060 [Cordylochernes scorpioides]